MRARKRKQKCISFYFVFVLHFILLYDYNDDGGQLHRVCTLTFVSLYGRTAIYTTLFSPLHSITSTNFPWSVFYFHSCLLVDVNPLESDLFLAYKCHPKELHSYLATQVSYLFRTVDFPTRHFPTAEQVGWIADEVRNIAPQLVRLDAD